MKSVNWTSFKKMIYIKGSLEEIYDLWATPKGISSWFLKEAHYKRGAVNLTLNEYANAGDTFEWRWHNWDGVETGEIVEVDKNSFITFTFADGLVCISLKPEKDRVLVVLEQRNIPTDEKSKMEIYKGGSNGWAFWLTNLKAFVEHGILLNETEIDLRNIEMSNFQFVNM